MTDKRKRDDTLAAHNVALHYSGRENQSVGQRQQSPIYHLRCLNNWVKSMLINAYVREKDRVLDFACGKGGDLTKYRKARVGTYTGVDIALESVRRDAVGRTTAVTTRSPPSSSRATPSPPTSPNTSR